MKTIAIVGARPAITPVSADEVWYVNSAISARLHFPNAQRHIHIVAGTLAVAYEQRFESPVDDGRVNSYRNGRSDELIVVGRRKPEEIYNLLWQLGYRTETISHLTPEQQEHAVRTRTGLRYPIGIHRTFSFGLPVAHRIILKSMKKLILYTYRERSITSFNRWHRVFTPSNGVFAAVLAMERNGEDSRFILTGFSLEPYAYTYAFGSHLSKTGIRDHYFADLEVLRRIRRYPVWSDDRSLCSTTGIRHFYSD